MVTYTRVSRISDVLRFLSPILSNNPPTSYSIYSWYSVLLSFCLCLPIFLSVWLIVDILNNFCFDNKAGKDSTTNTSTNICALSFTDIVLKRQNVSESYDFPGDISDTENLKLPRVIAEDPPLRRVGPVFFPRLHFELEFKENQILFLLLLLNFSKYSGSI